MLLARAAAAAGGAGPFDSVWQLLAAHPADASSSFIRVAKAAGVWDALAAAEGITVLVPSDAAWAAALPSLNVARLEVGCPCLLARSLGPPPAHQPVGERRARRVPAAEFESRTWAPAPQDLLAPGRRAQAAALIHHHTIAAVVPASSALPGARLATLAAGDPAAVLVGSKTSGGVELAGRSSSCLLTSDIAGLVVAPQVGGSRARLPPLPLPTPQPPHHTTHAPPHTTTAPLQAPGLIRAAVYSVDAVMLPPPEAAQAQSPDPFASLKSRALPISATAVRERTRPRAALCLGDGWGSATGLASKDQLLRRPGALLLTPPPPSAPTPAAAQCRGRRRDCGRGGRRRLLRQQCQRQQGGPGNCSGAELEPRRRPQLRHCRAPDPGQ
jgi:hypothetical protein